MFSSRQNALGFKQTCYTFLGTGWTTLIKFQTNHFESQDNYFRQNLQGGTFYKHSGNILQKIMDHYENQKRHVCFFDVFSVLFTFCHWFREGHLASPLGFCFFY